MPTIPATQARAAFTQAVVGTHTDALPAPGFLRSFFPNEQSFTKYLSFEAERIIEAVASDVQRQSDGNRNSFDNSTEKIILPPFYKEFIELTSIDLYDRLFGSTSIDAGVFSQIVAIAARRLMMVHAKIERMYEVQCAGVLQTGVVTLVNATTINYGRLAASMIDKTGGNYWATDTVSPFTDLSNGCQFLREVGKAPGETFNAILGLQAFRDMQANAIYKNRVTQNLNNNIDIVNAPQRNSLGATYHGTLSCDNYKVNIWTYPQSYDIISGDTRTATSYIDSKKVIILPQNPNFKLGFAAVPQVLSAGTGTAIDGLIPELVAKAYVPYESIDTNIDSHKLGLKSAGIAIPVARDQVYTVQVVAS